MYKFININYEFNICSFSDDFYDDHRFMTSDDFDDDHRFIPMMISVYN